MRQKQLVIGMAIILLMALLIMGLFSPEGVTMTGFATLSTDRNMENTTTVYSVVPITRVDMDYSLDEYEEIVSKAKEMVKDCRGKSEPGSNYYATLENCIEEHMSVLWSIEGSDDTYYMFKVIGVNTVRQYNPDKNKVIDEEITYRFALDFS